MSARAVLSLRLLPPEYVPLYRSACLVRSSCSMSSCTTSSMHDLGRARSEANMCSISRPVIESTKPLYCGQYPRSWRTAPKLRRTSLPLTLICPADMLVALVSMRKVDVLPAPLTPRRPKHSPFVRPNERFLTTMGEDEEHMPRYCLLRFFTVRMSVPDVLPPSTRWRSAATSMSSLCSGWTPRSPQHPPDDFFFFSSAMRTAIQKHQPKKKRKKRCFPIPALPHAK